MTDDELLDASESYEAERRLWTVRKDKMTTPFNWEIVRNSPLNEPINPVVHLTACDRETAYYEMENIRGVASMRAALNLDP